VGAVSELTPVARQPVTHGPIPAVLARQDMAMDTIVAIAVAVGLWKGQAAPQAKPPEAAAVARPVPVVEKPPRHKSEWQLGF